MAGEAPCRWKNGLDFGVIAYVVKLEDSRMQKGSDGTGKQGWFTHVESVKVGDFLVVHQTDSRHSIIQELGIKQ